MSEMGRNPGTSPLVNSSLSEIEAASPVFSTMFAGLSQAESEILVTYLEPILVLTGDYAIAEGDMGRDMYFVRAGRAQVTRHELELQEVGPGDHIGEFGLILGASQAHPRAASVRAVSDLSLLKLSEASWTKLRAEHPAVALGLLQTLISKLALQLTSATDNVGVLLRERSLPRRTHIDVNICIHTDDPTVSAEEPKSIPMGTPVGQILPQRVNGALVVAALIDRKPVRLDTRLIADSRIELLDTASWEGREVVRRSAGLLLLEAAHRVAPQLDVRLGPSLSSAQTVEVPEGTDVESLAPQILQAMRDLCKSGVTFREEFWAVEEAIHHFQSKGWEGAAKLLSSWRDPMVPLVTCGQVYALSLAPLIMQTEALADLDVRPYFQGLLLEFGEEITRMLPAGIREVGPRYAASPSVDQSTDPPQIGANQGQKARSPDMVREHLSWLNSMGVTSVGAFNERCVTGQVSELIRASEGFHEKRIGRIADQIAAKRELRIICIAGPSSSGKTTFIKRLIVQLQINGVTPKAISLDDYYVNRESTPKDEKGEYDYEALEALGLDLLQEQIGGLLRGNIVRPARYDFLTGQSLPNKGAPLQLGSRDVLLLEGIHGLNPNLLGNIAKPAEVFRIFIHPVVGLPLDRLSSVSPADIRLVRRIVRDRHSRGAAAADNIQRWPSVRDGERKHIFPFLPIADTIFDSSLAYEPSVLKVYADRYLLEVPREHPSYTTAYRLRRLLDHFVTIYPEHVPPTSLLREFLGGSGFEY